MLVRRGDVFPIECVVRGYLAGSGWKDYQRTGEVCGHRLPQGLRDSDELPSPIFSRRPRQKKDTMRTLASSACRDIGGEDTSFLRETSLRLYHEAREYARTRGIIIADTKFEFARDANGRIILIDEALTPDSSRFWPVSQYEPGKSQASFDKQFVRDYLETLDWNNSHQRHQFPRRLQRQQRPDISKRTSS